MKIKSIVSAIVMAGTFGAGAETVTKAGMLNELTTAGQFAQLSEIKIKTINKIKQKYSLLKDKTVQAKYLEKNQHEGKKRYIVRLVDDSVTSYRGDIQGFEKTTSVSAKSVLNNTEFSPKSDSALKYIAYLDGKQSTFIEKASAKLGAKLSKLQSYKYAINGILTELTYAEAKNISTMHEVAFIEQDKLMELNTDTGPLLIGAGEVWDGTATGTEYQGEGTIIGIIDTGINTDHRSFAATGDDGYTVVNPLGVNNYLGDCAADASLCNSKLIGVRSYSAITSAYSDSIFSETRPQNGEDYNGHGSHTASTAGGNVLTDVPYMVNDFVAGVADDGIETSYIFSRMSGVAPHANIIAYQVCLPGNSGDTYAGCFGSATVSAIEDSIVDGVDVLNYSIGGTTNFSPWTSAIEIGFLNAQAAGIFVATSAGNSGPGPSTSTKVSPWYTSVAASNHGNSTITGDAKSIGTFTGGDTAAPQEIIGGGINGSFTGDLVYAGNFTNSNDPSGDPAQCLEPFPANTFTANQIVVCDRGAIARVQKAANAASGSAGGFVLANMQGGSETISEDFYAIPGIHISADNGDVLKTWMASGTGHVGTISASNLSRLTNTVDQIAGFSSRGPNEFGEIITPQIAAPGVSIYAAYADDQPFSDVNGGSPVDFSFLSGTSMASPHMAGAGALMSQAHPTWNPDQIRSALMMTAVDSMLKEDGQTAADALDMGAGRAQINLAVNAGLVMSETAQNYYDANPANGGDVKTLNIPSMANASCAGDCSWTRTFTATKDGSFTITASSENLTMTPSSFDLTTGENVSVIFSLDVSENNTGSQVFETVNLTASGQPDLHLPVYVLVNNGAVPGEVNMTAGKNSGSWLVSGLKTIPTDNLNFTIDGLFDANAVGFSETVDFDIEEDSNTNPIDDFTEVFTFEFSVPANSVSLNASISESTSPDNDLFILMDTTGDGIYNSVVAQAASLATNESASILAPPEGNYLAIVQNYTASAAGASDTGKLTVNVVPQTDPVAGLSVDAPSTANGDVNAKLVWDIAMVPGDSYYADVSMFAGNTKIGTFRATLDRVADDVFTSTAQTLAARGEVLDYTVSVNPSVYNQDQAYSISVDMPKNMALVEGSAVVSGGDLTIKDPNAVGLSLSSEFDIAVDPTNGEYKDDLTQVHVFEFDVPSGTVSLTATISDSTSPDNDLFVEYFDGSDWILVGYSATGATNESKTIGAPAEGMYRAIVQNWAASSAATDTGLLTITTVPATGEGFIWNFNAKGVKPLYTVTSSASSASCANAGFGGYLALADFSFPTLGFAGDTISGTLFGGTTFPFFGEDRTNGMTITDDGFAYFSGTSGSSPWANTAIPNPSEPNDMIAMLWKDMEIIDDGVRGVRAFQSAANGYSYVDFSGTQGWRRNSERLTYSVFAWNSVSDVRDEVIVAYSANQIGELVGATAGVENSDGTAGTDASSLMEPGVQLCYNYNEPPVAYEVTFQVMPNSSYLGQSAAPNLTVTTDLVGSQDYTISAESVELVNVAPVANAGDDIVYDRASAPSQIQLSASGTLDLDEDVLSYRWSQVSGSPVGLFSTGAINAFFNLSGVSNGTYVFSVVVSDGEFSSTDEISITIEGKDANSGVGSMGTILLLIFGISLFTRRRNL